MSGLFDVIRGVSNTLKPRQLVILFTVNDAGCNVCKLLCGEYVLKLPKSATGYSHVMLELYDFLILKLSSMLIWRCRTSQLIELYRTHVSRQHLEVGVGTGYLLNRAVFPSHWVQLHILDCNPKVLQHAYYRLARYNPVLLLCNLMSDDWPALPKQQSIGMNYVWHALEGSLAERGQVFGKLAAQLSENGVLFGSSVIGVHDQMPKLSQRVSRHWLRVGLFNNREDRPDMLRAILSQHFFEVNVWQEGQVMLFIAKRPKPTI